MIIAIVTILVIVAVLIMQHDLHRIKKSVQLSNDIAEQQWKVLQEIRDALSNQG